MVYLKHNKQQRKVNNMNKNEAKLELFKTDRKIEKTLDEWATELGQHNKSMVYRKLQTLWDRKNTLQNIINNWYEWPDVSRP